MKIGFLRQRFSRHYQFHSYYFFAVVFLLVGDAAICAHAESDPAYGPSGGGDMLKHPNEVLKPGITNEKGRWPNLTLVYHVTSEFTVNELRLIQAAMNEIKNKTCIQFQPASTGDYVLYTKGKGSGCGSNIGRIGGQQFVNLPSHCFLVGHGTAMHETLHALGFDHEQSRSDRDDFVTIVWGKITDSAKADFQKIPTKNEKYGKYDYGSIMHYPKGAFAKIRGETTILTKNNATIGQRQKLSPMDVQKINKMYHC